MKLKTLKTHPIRPGESLFQILDQYVTFLTNGSIIAITSKIISLCQGRVLSKDVGVSEYELISREADAYLSEDQSSYSAHLTIKNNILIPSAGIDKSNGNGMYILYPNDIQQSAHEIWVYLQKKHRLSDFGLIITDSHTTPLRKGVTGIGLGWCGFEPLRNYVGEPDIFNQKLKVTQANILDGLATSAVLLMGEGNEQTPIVVMKNVPRIQFVNRPPTPEEVKSISIPIEQDIYRPLLNNVGWIWNKKDRS